MTNPVALADRSSTLHVSTRSEPTTGSKRISGHHAPRSAVRNRQTRSTGASMVVPIVTESRGTGVTGAVP
ncbi:hypothetical protein ASG06_01340 [Rathayibacter sp. Leaf185]|nr:hypothetical protein ASF42_01340 [Rathayibacter sp. Leaf294]KQS13146.1 hypothetical protein ASG06_01340 [Rathayibacter sp. Leaf185]